MPDVDFSKPFWWILIAFVAYSVLHHIATAALGVGLFVALKKRARFLMHKRLGTISKWATKRGLSSMVTTPLDDAAYGGMPEAIGAELALEKYISDPRNEAKEATSFLLTCLNDPNIGPSVKQAMTDALAGASADVIQGDLTGAIKAINQGLPPVLSQAIPSQIQSDLAAVQNANAALLTAVGGHFGNVLGSASGFLKDGAGTMVDKSVTAVNAGGALVNAAPSITTSETSVSAPSSTTTTVTAPSTHAVTVQPPAA